MASLTTRHRAAEEQDFDDEDRDVLEDVDSGINFEKIRSTLLRNRYVIVGSIVVCLLAALAVTVLMRPRYTAAASIQIDDQVAKVLRSEDGEQAPSAQDADRFLQTRIDVLQSRSMAERVANRLRLDRDGTFITQMTGKPPADTANTPAARRERVVALLRSNLKVDLPRTSRVASVKFTSPSPQLAAKVADAFAEEFIVANLQRRFDATSYARNFLQGRLDDVRQRLESSERQVNVYARDAGLIDASNAAPSGGANTGGGPPRSLTLARLVQLNGALASAQTARLEAEQRWNQARRAPLLSLPEVLANASIQELRQQRAQLAAGLEEEKQRHRDAYPSMVQQSAKLAELDDQIGRMAQDVRRSIADSYQTALRQESEIRTDVGALEGEARTEQDRSVRFNILRREVDTNRELYDGLLQRFKELSAEAGVTTNNISIVDHAEVPRIPTSPRLTLNLALGLLFGLVAAAAIVIARETFDDRVRLPEDVPVKLGLPLLASVPAATAASPVADLEAPKSDFSEAFQALRATLELSTSRGMPATLLLTSTRPSEGKSTSAYAIARTFSRQGRRTVLVDGDLRRPSLHKVLGLDNAVGLSNLLTGREVEGAVRALDSAPGLSVVTSGPIPPDPAQLLQADAVRSVLADLHRDFDLVVVDAPPVLGLADTLEWAAAVEGVLFVVEAGSMHFGGVRASIKRLRDVRATMLGVILNKFDAKAVGYGTNYSYAYTYRYGTGR
jgi:succinoglycan biosynthesis transport protein ExoP